MQQVNLHKTKLFALAEAAIGLIGLFLAWTVEQYPNQQMGGMGGFGQMNGGMNAMVSQSQNGFHSWGFLSLIGIIVVVAVSVLMGDKSKDYDQNGKTMATLGFLGLAAGALIYFFVLNSTSKTLAMQYQQQYGINYSATAGMGLWITFGAGLVGMLWVTGILNKLSTTNTTPPPPPAAPTPPVG